MLSSIWGEGSKVPLNWFKLLISPLMKTTTKRKTVEGLKLKEEAIKVMGKFLRMKTILMNSILPLRIGTNS